MSLSSEDRLFLRDLFNGIRDVQRETNALLEEIRDLLKSPPVTIERRTGIPPQDWNKFAADALHQARCTCGESKGLCPVHEPAQYSIECTCDGRSAAICQVPGHRR